MPEPGAEVIAGVPAAAAGRPRPRRRVLPPGPGMRTVSALREEARTGSWSTAGCRHPGPRSLGPQELAGGGVQTTISDGAWPDALNGLPGCHGELPIAHRSLLGGKESFHEEGEGRSDRCRGDLARPHGRLSEASGRAGRGGG